MRLKHNTRDLKKLNVYMIQSIYELIRYELCFFPNKMVILNKEFILTIRRVLLRNLVAYLVVQSINNLNDIWCKIVVNCYVLECSNSKKI